MSLADVFVADRSLGEAAFVETLPEAVVAAAGLVTRLGDPLTLLVIVAAGYLLANRLGVGVPRMATALALAIGAFALTLALKHAFSLPRPPGAGVDGYGFPSGHAIGATVVYGGLLSVLPSDRRSPAAVAAAGTLVVLVAASRVVIGVHYLVDVAVGVAVGLAYLAAALRIGPGLVPDRVTVADARRVFAVALVAGLAGVAVAVVRDTVVAVAAAGGGLVGWHLAADRIVAARGSLRGLALSVLTLLVVVVSVEAVLETGLSLAAAAVLTVCVVALLVGTPGLADRLVEKELDVGR